MNKLVKMMENNKKINVYKKFYYDFRNFDEKMFLYVTKITFFI